MKLRCQPGRRHGSPTFSSSTAQVIHKPLAGCIRKTEPGSDDEANPTDPHRDRALGGWLQDTKRPSRSKLSSRLQAPRSSLALPPMPIDLLTCHLDYKSYLCAFSFSMVIRRSVTGSRLW